MGFEQWQKENTGFGAWQRTNVAVAEPPIDRPGEATLDPRSLMTARMELPLPTAGAEPSSIGQPKVAPPPMESAGVNRLAAIKQATVTPNLEGTELTSDDFVAAVHPPGQQQPTLPPRQFRNSIDEFVRALGRGSLNVGSGLLATFADVAQDSVFDVDRINELAETARTAAQKPTFQPGTDGGIKGFVANAVGDALPFMAGTIAATLVAGPVAGFGVAYAVEGKSSYFDALEGGATQAQAEMEGMIVGSINASLELLQVNRVFRFAKLGKGSVKSVAAAAKKNVLRTLAKQGAKMTKETVALAITEGVQEALQETTAILAPATTGRKIQKEGKLERIGQAALGGAVAGVVLGGGGRLAQAAMPGQAQAPPQTTPAQPTQPPVAKRPAEGAVEGVKPTKAQRQHKAAVEQLFKKGKPVRQQYRDMYPDLVEKYEPEKGVQQKAVVKEQGKGPVEGDKGEQVKPAEAAKPRTFEVYHGGPSTVQELDPATSDYVDLRGVYFTEDKEYAQTFAEQHGKGEGVVRKYKVTLQNPANDKVVDAKEAEAKELGYKEPQLWEWVTEELKAAGYDGAVLEDKATTEVVAFDKESIKPAPTEAAKEVKIASKVEQYWGKGHMITATGQLGPKIVTSGIKGVPAVKGKELITRLFEAVQADQISKEDFNLLQDRIADVISAERLKTRAGNLTKTQETQLKLQPPPTFEEVETEIDKAITAPKPTAKAKKGTAAIGTVSKGRIKVSMEPEGKVQTAAEIIQYIERAFNIPVRGKATHRKHALGWFDPKAVGIRLKNVRSLTTAMHEIGHHIDWTLNKRLSLKPPKGTKDELMALGKALYGSRKPPGGYKSEGWAEFMRMDLTGDDTEAAAPNLHKWFHETYLPSHQDIRKKLEKTREMITRWRMQGAEARIESQINRKTIKGTIADRLERGILWFETKWIDKFAPIRKAVQATGEELRWDLDPFQLATARASKAGAIARQMVLEYTTDTAGNYTGPGLRDVIAPVRKDIRTFTRYMMAARGRNLWKRGINPGFSQADADFVFEKYDSPEWRDAAQAVTDWNHRILDYLVEAGGLESAVAKHMKELNPVYIPFLRAFAVGEINKPSGIGKGFKTTGKSVKAIKGSGRQSIEMLEAMIQQTAKLIGVAHKTEVAKALAGLAKKKGMAQWIWKVPAPKQATQFEAEQLKKEITQIAVERLGLDRAEIPFDTETWDDVLTVYTNAGQFYGKENIVAIVVDGQKQFYEVHPQLYRAIEGLDKYNLPPILDMLFGKATRMIRLGATGLNAAFGLIRNPIRDAMTFTVLSKHAKLGPISAAAGIVEDVINTKAARRFKALGGKMSGQILFDRTATQHLRGELLATTIAGKAVYHATHPINALRELFGITEAGTRIGEFGPALKAAEKKYGKGSKAAAIEALNAAQDVTTNFTRNGEIGRVLNQIIPFFNAGIQGPSKILRTFRARPIETTIKALVALTLPALWLWWKNRDKEWYKNLAAYEKTSYLHIEVPGKDKIIRLPVPFELGHLFQSIPVAILDAQYQDDPDSMKGTMVEVMEKANPFDWPALIGPLIDVIGNETYAGIPIVSRSMEGKLPEDRVTSHTTALMRELGKVLNVSPAQLEHLINSYSGGIYKRTARIIDIKGEIPSDIPIIGTLFLRDPFAPKAQVEKFYDRSDLLDQKNQSDKITPAENRERLQLGRIRRKLSPLWENLRTAKTVGQRKQIWTKIKTEIDKQK